MRTIATAALAMFLPACDLFITGPEFPAEARPFTPPPHFVWWCHLVEQCAVRTGNLDSIQWYTLPDVIRVEGGEYAGYWWGDGNRVVLAQGNERYGDIVRHEMLHALLHQGSHDREYFGGRCAELVSCNDCFASDAGVPRAEVAAAVELPARSLSVTIEERRPDASFGLDAGFVGLVVRVRNERTTPVLAELRHPATFGYVVHAGGETGTYEWTPETRVFFRAGQERRWHFDHQFCRPGIYPVSGLYNEAHSEPVPITISEPVDSPLCQLPTFRGVNQPR